MKLHGMPQLLLRLMMEIDTSCHISRGMRVHRLHTHCTSLTVSQNTKAQIDEIYRLRNRQNLADAVKDNKFTVQDGDGNTILPSCWEQVVRPSAILQIVLNSDILNPEIASRYPYADDPTPRYRQRKLSAILPDSDAESAELLDVEGSVSHRSDDASEDDKELALDSISSVSDGADSEAREKVPDEFLRQVTVPTDGDGNILIFQVDTTFPVPPHQESMDDGANNEAKKRDTKVFAGNAELMSIAKAVSAQSDSRTSLQIHILPGPRTPLTDPDVSIRWFHVQSERLDFASFRQTCLIISGLSGRLQKLVRRLLDKVEKEKLKVFLGGMFIEPGTVLRADEKHQTDPQSVIFSCIPYFDLQTPSKETSTTTNRFSSRTLMESYYPFEPVQDRDAEQAHRLFGNERRNALVHVPNIWMLNIGSNLVATCGHGALSNDFVQSIEVVETSRFQEMDEQAATATIRLRDWDHRSLLYTREECRSFFQMEQRLRELRLCSACSQTEKSLQLSWHTSDGIVKVAPDLWPGIFRQRDAIFIDLELSSDEPGDDENKTGLKTTPQSTSPSIPFFHWPQALDMEKTRTEALIPDDIKTSIRCLQNVEKAMLSVVLSSHGSYSTVEETFTTTAYYRSLPEETTAHVKLGLPPLLTISGESKSFMVDSSTVHEALVDRQRHAIAKETLELYETVQSTLALFVSHVDKTTMLRKLWGAMKSIIDIANVSCKRSPLRDGGSMSESARQPQISQGWFVRPDMDNHNILVPSQKVKRTFERCRRCSSNKMYETSKAAVSHLNKHLRLLDAAISNHVQPEQWIASYSQKELETWNEGTASILKAVRKIAQQLFVQAKELSDGVRNEDGQMSALYTLPHALLNAFRQLLVFYFAAERSLFFTEESFSDRRKAIEAPEYMTALPFSAEGLRVIEAFGNGVQQALTSAREELCYMVKSKEPVEVFKRLSLSPEYVCGWLMRRLLVKPLENSMTVSDMYREYLSTIQFQVNHRPGKRLLRSINLLQEEIAALQEVNTQQSKLISNYMSVLDDETYEKDIPGRRAMFPYERMLLESCRDSLKMTDQEYRYLLARCGPLSDSTKQSLEINEEDHGKAIMVFTIVTVIFLPLSFVTSFLGMNTTDIRDMDSSSTLFWVIAIPLTAFTMGSVLYIGYNGDDLRDVFNSVYRTVTGKQNRNIGARGISVAQRKLARTSVTGSNSTLDFSSLADEAEFANPRPEDFNNTWSRGHNYPRRQYTLEEPTMHWQPYASAADPVAPEPRTGLRTEPFKQNGYAFENEPVELYLQRTKRDRHSRLAPDPTIRETARIERPEVRTYNETIALDDRRTRRHYSPPTMAPPSVRRTHWNEEDGWYTSRRPMERSRVHYDVPPPIYEWTKKSHRQYSTRGGTRRRTDDKDDCRKF
ncbi:uncharacterized protein M421DRAFT_415626 [Didymella exigua CBS 183.55]|uniref:Cora-domain-containing protein n=1 Tax=Didymella exigua CBS 183.55 TaxID=1150837 RepID=A0A6A5RY05_9PLEO|nr:uncharacterized protein M421DRAFT_415626 [Didymella exigua CBS 183.55]KAF1933281.1 hypothetical protein M421DRAFT_415626 [Didymella exigua CBS 183.55]